MKKLFLLLVLSILTSANVSAETYPTGYLKYCQNKFDGICGEYEESISTISLDKIKEINKSINDKVKYKTDLELYAVPDMWADGLITGFGDCEDFVIAKMHTLASNGLSYNDMKMVLGNYVSVTEEHILLVVKYNNIEYVLDIGTDIIQPISDYKKFIPTYSQGYNLGPWNEYTK